MDLRRRVLGAAVLCAFCVGSAAAQPVPAKIVVAVLTPAMVDETMVVGIANGTFKKHGLDVEARPVANGFEALKAGRPTSGLPRRPRSHRRWGAALV